MSNNFKYEMKDNYSYLTSNIVNTHNNLNNTLFSIQDQWAQTYTIFREIVKFTIESRSQIDDIKSRILQSSETLSYSPKVWEDVVSIIQSTLESSYDMTAKRSIASKELLRKLNDYHHYQNTYNSIIDNLSSNERENIIKEDLNFVNEIDEIVSTDNWQMTLKKKENEFKATKPYTYAIIALIIGFLISQLLNSIMIAFTNKQTHVLANPTQNTQIITNIEINTNVYIIDDIPYYYKISLVDEDDNVIEGWVSKRSLDIKPRNISEHLISDTK